jgi:catalase
VYIKYHFIADHGQKQFTAEEAIQICGEDPDFSKRDLYRAIEKGEKISWTAHVQMMKPEEADPATLGFDPFDVTKVWPKGQFPVRTTPGSSPGILSLTRYIDSCMNLASWS